MTEAKNIRAALLDQMREPFRLQAEKNAALYREFGGVTPEDAIRKGMDALWLKSATDGSEAYHIYRVSPLWQIISSEVLRRDRHLCAACGRDAELVHHVSYGFAAMAGLDDSKLVSLCQPCHRYIHFDTMRKIPKAGWSKRLKVLRKHFARKRKNKSIVLSR